MKSRVEKNQKLYETLYDGELNPNDIEVELKPTSLNSESDSLREKHRSKVVLREDVNDDVDKTTKEEQEEKKSGSYDINSLIDEAKAKFQGDEEKDSNTQYDILKSLNLDKNDEDKSVAREDIQDHELTREQGIIFDDLMPDHENTVLTDAIVSETTITEITVNNDGDDDSFADTFVSDKKEKEVESYSKESDDTFYTGNFKFKEKELMKKSKKEKKKDGGLLVKILLMILGILITVLVLYIVNNYIK